jgi:hypothetical protein
MGAGQRKVPFVPWGMYAFLWLLMAALTGIGYYAEWLTGFSSGTMDNFAIALGFLAVLTLFLRWTLGPNDPDHNFTNQHPRTKTGKRE